MGGEPVPGTKGKAIIDEESDYRVPQPVGFAMTLRGALHSLQLDNSG
jgi:hypothetical protein